MAETNAGALREAGARDAQALTVTGRRRAHTGSIRHAARTLAHAAKAVTPETPDGAWLRDNHTLARAAADDAAAALHHAHTLRASGKQTVLHACCAGLLRACGNALTLKAAQAYLAGFQDVLPLETAELALLVPGLQAAAVCALADTYARDGAAAPALFTSLRALGTAAWAALTERCDRVGRILARDPVGVYPAMDAATRTCYRQTVAQLARRTGRTEIDIAEDVLARAQSGEGARRHVGWFLLREVLGAPEKRSDGAWYIAAVIMGTLALSLLLGFATGSVSGAVLLLIPVSEAVKGLLDAVLLRVTKPRFVPRLALRRGIPPEGKTLCVIAALLTRSPRGWRNTRCATAMQASSFCSGCWQICRRRTWSTRPSTPPSCARRARRSRRSTHAMAGGFTSSRASGCRRPTGNGARGSASAARCSGSRSFCAGRRTRCTVPPAMRRRCAARHICSHSTPTRA